MCRLFALTSNKPLSPMKAIEALDVMREGHDGSGVGLFLRDLGGPFENMKDAHVRCFQRKRAKAPGHIYDGNRFYDQIQAVD